jgi:hypothetical protein
MSITFDALLKELSSKRRAFHSEADFQHSLAWLLHQKFPDAKIRLEYPIYLEDKRRLNIDIWLEIHSEKIAIELKYKKKNFEGIVDGEKYDLHSASAVDLACYDFWKDVERTEHLVKEGLADRGLVTMLTNETALWGVPQNQTPRYYDAFRINDGRNIPGGLMKWNLEAAAGTRKGRERDLDILNSYLIQWSDYSKVTDKGGRATPFRYLILEMNRS